MWLTVPPGVIKLWYTLTDNQCSTYEGILVGLALLDLCGPIKWCPEAGPRRPKPWLYASTWCCWCTTVSAPENLQIIQPLLKTHAKLSVDQIHATPKGLKVVENAPLQTCELGWSPLLLMTKMLPDNTVRVNIFRPLQQCNVYWRESRHRIRFTACLLLCLMLRNELGPPFSKVRATGAWSHWHAIKFNFH